MYTIFFSALSDDVCRREELTIILVRIIRLILGEIYRIIKEPFKVERNFSHHDVRIDLRDSYKKRTVY